MARSLKNWIVNSDAPRGFDVVSYTPKKWARVVEGPAFVSTILASNTAPFIEPDPNSGAPPAGTEIRLRIADAFGDTVILFEPGALIRNKFSDKFTNDSLVIQEGQFLEFWADNPDMQLLVSGTG